jgi:hypothetical protein
MRRSAATEAAIAAGSLLVISGRPIGQVNRATCCGGIVLIPQALSEADAFVREPIRPR